MDVDLRRAARRAAFVLGWVVLPLALLAYATLVVARGAGVDFDANVWLPGEAVLEGRSPYPPADLAQLVRPTLLYPPLLLALGVPLHVLPHDVARLAFLVLEAGAVLAAMRIVGVRDRRVLLWASLCFPVFYGESLGNPTILLLLPVAAAWRWRDRPLVAGLAVGVAGAFKLILWPLGVWLLATRRLTGAALAGAAAAAGVLVPWALIGFDGFADYPAVARLYEEHSGRPRALTVATLAHRLGLEWGAARALQVGVGLGVLAAAVVVARRTDGDRRSFTLALVAALVLTPIVWVQYLALLVVPLAIAQPTFGRAWWVVQATWVYLLLPRGDAFSVRVDGRVLETAGYLPTLPRLLAVLGLLAVAAVGLGGVPRARRRDPGTVAAAAPGLPVAQGAGA